MNELISIIIPVFNVENYLKRCIDTVINQTYKNVEIILVDDGSTDSSGRMCDELKNDDDRITVIHKSNGGLSEARNYGIEKARGEWIAFVDSDDWISLNMIERLYDLAVNNDADIAVCGYYEEDGTIDAYSSVEPVVKVCANNIEAINELLCNGQQIGTMVWNRLYKRQILNNIRFEVGRINEDIYFTPKAFYYSRRIVITTERLYHYYVSRKDSITNKPLSEKNLDAVDAFSDVALFFEEHSLSEFALKYWRRYYSMMIWMYCRFKEQGQEKSSRILKYKIKHHTKSAVKCYFKLHDYKLMSRLFFFLLFPQLYYLVWRYTRV